MRPKIHTPIPLVLLLLMFLALPLSASAQSNNVFIVTNVDKSGFPTVQVNFRAIDAQDNLVLTNLNDKNVTVYENGQPVLNQKVSRNGLGPINLIFVIELGSKSNYQDFGLATLRRIITSAVTELDFEDKVDTVQVLGRENINTDQTITLLEKTQYGNKLVDWANRFDFRAKSNTSSHDTKGLQGVSDALAAAADLVPVPGSQTTVIIFITRYVEDPVTASADQVAQNLAQAAKEKFVTIYAFQTMLDRKLDPQYSQPLLSLTSGSINGYTPLLPDSNETAVKRVYQAIKNQRTMYSVTYQSQMKSAGVGQITINAPQAAAPDVAGTFEITGDVLSASTPTVEITQPINASTLRREATLAADGKTWVLDANRLTVAAKVTWQGSAPHRNFPTAELLVDDKPVNVEAEWEPDQSGLTFSWDISAIQETRMNIPISVRLTDDLGATIQDAITVNIQVIPPPDTSCKPGDITCDWTLWLLLGFGVLVILAGALALVYYLRRRAIQALREKKQANNRYADEFPGGQSGLATLSVLQGPPEMLGKKLLLVQAVTVFGRDPTQVDIVFYENKNSSVSRVHCMIKTAGNLFLLTDRESSNGTYVNGNRLHKGETIPLHNGDMLVLGELARGGVKLRFNRP